MKANKADVWPIAGKAFPEYKGRKFNVQVTDHVYLSDLNFDGGSRNKYVAVALDNLNATALQVAAQFDPKEGKIVKLIPGFAVVEHTMFCGHDCGLTVHIHPVNAPARLTAA